MSANESLTPETGSIGTPSATRQSVLRAVVFAALVGFSMTARESSASYSNQAHVQAGIGGCTSLYECSDPGSAYWFGYGGYAGEPGGPLSPSPTLSFSETRSDPGHGSTVTATAHADFGRLGVYALASPPSDPYVIGVPGHQFSYPDVATASAHAEFDDFLTVSGPIGTPTIVIFTSVLSGYMLPNASWGRAELVTYVNDPLTPLIRNNLHNKLTGAGGVITRAGSVLHVHVDLTVSVTASSANVVPTTVLGDLLHTGILYADVKTPGLSLASWSGIDYSTPAPVPEPGAWLLFAAGLAVVASRTRGMRGAR